MRPVMYPGFIDQRLYILLPIPGQRTSVMQAKSRHPNFLLWQAPLGLHGFIVVMLVWAAESVQASKVWCVHVLLQITHAHRPAEGTMHFQIYRV